MRNIYDVIRQKEAEVQQLERELEALRLAAKLLTDDAKADVVEAPKPMRMTTGVAMSSSMAPSVKNDTEVVLSAPLRQFP